MTQDKLKVVGITLLAVVAVSLGETLLTKGMKQTGGGGFWQVAIAAVTNRYVVTGTFLMAIYFGMYMAALKMATLSFVLPLTAFSFILGGLLAKYYLHEDVGLMKWVGYVVIVMGVILVGVGEASSK